MFDPFISPNEQAANVNLEEIPADYVLISHGHEDHVADAEAVLKRTGAKVISNFEIVSWFGGKGIENGHPMNFGGSWQFDFGIVKYVQAVHSSVMPDGAYGGNPGGFIIETNGKCVYYAGDTALTMDMKLFGEQHNIDVAILPVGDNFTMGYRDAVMAAEFVNCDRVIGVHFDTFGFIEIDHAAAKAAFSDKGKSLTLPSIGETIDL